MACILHSGWEPHTGWGRVFFINNSRWSKAFSKHRRSLPELSDIVPFLKVSRIFQNIWRYLSAPASHSTGFNEWLPGSSTILGLELYQLTKHISLCQVNLFSWICGGMSAFVKDHEVLIRCSLDTFSFAKSNRFLNLMKSYLGGMLTHKNIS